MNAKAKMISITGGLCSLSFIFYDEGDISRVEHKGITGGERDKQTNCAEAQVQTSELWLVSHHT